MFQQSCASLPADHGFVQSAQTQAKRSLLYWVSSVTNRLQSFREMMRDHRPHKDATPQGDTASFLPSHCWGFGACQCQLFVYGSLCQVCSQCTVAKLSACYFAVSGGFWFKCHDCCSGMSIHGERMFPLIDNGKIRSR